jgi:hypothetical protein
MNEQEQNQLCGRKLTFGDNQQIDALKKIEAENSEEMKTWDVDIDFSGSYNCTIEAISEQEAIEQAKEEFDVHSSDIDIEGCFANEIKKDAHEPLQSNS